MLLERIAAAGDLAWLGQLPAVDVLRQLWADQYTETEDHRLTWRLPAAMPPPAEQISSPYDPEARYSVKRDTAWIGYKVHFTETCDPEMPHVIVNVETTPATTPDDHMAAVVHASLKQRDLLPGEHLVDKGYTDAETLVDSAHDYGVTLVGPVANDPSWQARTEGGLDKSRFTVDWERQEVTCPAGKRSASWLPNSHPKNGVVIEALFARKDCMPCPLRPLCTRAKTGARVVGLQAREHHEALQVARRNQTSEAFRDSYAARAGIEGTHGQAVRRCGLRHCRYLGLPKIYLQHILTAVALNVVRIAEWLAGTPLAKTRQSRFAALQPAA